MIELGTMSTYADQQIPQTIPAGELAKHHAQQLIPAFKVFDIIVPGVGINASVKYPVGKKSSNLVEDKLSLIHGLGFDPKVKSNRHQSIIACKHYQSRFQRTSNNFTWTLLIN